MNEERIEQVKRKIDRYLDDDVKNKEFPGKKLSESQKKTLRAFYLDLQLGKGIGKNKSKSVNTHFQYISNLRRFGLFLGKSYKKTERKDLDAYLEHILSRSSSFLGWTMVLLKTFFTWLYYKNGKIEMGEIPKMVEDFKGTPDKIKKIRAEEVLMPEDIKQLINECTNDRDKLMIALLFESAVRVGELVDLNIGNAKIDEYGAILEILDGKTGDRNIRVIDCVPYLQRYLNNHPSKDNPKSPLFISFDRVHHNYGGRLATQSIHALLKTIGKKAGNYTKVNGERVGKRVNPHWFRHSGLDWLAKNGFIERDMRIRAGWGTDSKMPGIYLHYQDEAVNEKYAKMKGILPVEKKIVHEELKPVICPRCEKNNPADSKFCNCGMVLSLEIVREEALNKEADEFVGKLMSSPMPSNASGDVKEIMYQMIMDNPMIKEKFVEIIEKYGSGSREIKAEAD
jgi:integrase